MGRGMEGDNGFDLGLGFEKRDRVGRSERGVIRLYSTRLGLEEQSRAEGEVPNWGSFQSTPLR